MSFTTLRTSVLTTVLMLSLPSFVPAQESNQQQLVQEEAEDYYGKWLKQDVVYIITDEEKAVFLSLTTPEEKEQFIEQFWFRRDPDPLTAENEFKEEHYRRIAYANENFASGIRGWQTDRGKIYIIHGPPDEIQSRPVGGPYHRPTEEGGGTTQVFPFVTWRYRYLEGIGSDVVIEFVDKTQSGEYRIALTPEEKDALLYVPNAGLTMSEELGMTRKEDRLIFTPENRFKYMGPFNYYHDPFDRYERYVQIRRQPEIKYNDLKDIVKVDVSYSALPFRANLDYLKLNDFQAMVPVTIEVENKELTFTADGEHRVSKVTLYGVVSNLSNRLVEEFDADIGATFGPAEFEQGLLGSSLFQKILFLDLKQRYKMTLVIKDSESGKVGVTSLAIAPPRFDGEDLKASSLILSDKLQQLDEVPDQERMFVLGDFYVRPNLLHTFSGDVPLNVYLQVYNAAFDQTSLEPSLDLTFRITQDGKTISEYDDSTGDSVQYFSGQRVVVAAGFPIKALESGRYQFEVDVTDKISQKQVSLVERFTVSRGPEAGSQN